jgi:hypothetical protein
VAVVTLAADQAVVERAEVSITQTPVLCLTLVLPELTQPAVEVEAAVEVTSELTPVVTLLLLAEQVAQV